MRTFTLSSADIEKCPIKSLSPQHYNDDGTCKCNEPPTLEPVEVIDTLTGTWFRFKTMSDRDKFVNYNTQDLHAQIEPGCFRQGNGREVMIVGLEVYLERQS